MINKIRWSTFEGPTLLLDVAAEVTERRWWVLYSLTIFPGLLNQIGIYKTYEDVVVNAKNFECFIRGDDPLDFSRMSEMCRQAGSKGNALTLIMSALKMLDDKREGARHE